MSDSVEPRWVKPLLLNDELNTRMLQNVTGGELVVGQLLAVRSMNESEAYLSAQLAIADGTWRQEFLFLAGNAIFESGTERRDKVRARTFMVLEMDTSGRAIGDPVYLSGSTPGAITLTAPANVRKVGQVVKVGVDGKVVVAPHMFQGFGFVPFTLDQKWRDDFDGDWEATFGAPAVVYVDNVAGSDTTGDGTVGNPWATLRKAILDIPHNRSALNTDEVVIELVYNGVGNPYSFPGEGLLGNMDRITIRGQTDSAPTWFTTAAPDVNLVDGTVEIEASGLGGTLNDQYKGYWIHVGQGPYDWTNPANYAHVVYSEYLGGSTHKLYVADKVAATWVGDMTLMEPTKFLVPVDMRTGVYAPGTRDTVIYDSAQFRLENLWLRNMTRVRLLGNDPVIVEGCFIDTLAWYIEGGSARFIRTYLRNSTVVPDHGCLDITGAVVMFRDGNTMDGTNVVEPDAGLNTGTLASLWLHEDARVHMEGGLWLRSHAHIEVDRGSFQRSNDAYIAVVVAVQQGGPGYTVPGVVTARPNGIFNGGSAGAHQAAELSLKGPDLTNYEYVVAAVGHDISLAIDTNLTTLRNQQQARWVSADGGQSPCSYDPGKGTRVRVNEETEVGMVDTKPVLVGQAWQGIIDWAQGEDQILLLGDVQDDGVFLSFFHPRLGGTHKLWAQGRAVGACTISWPANVVWSAGAPPALPASLYQLFVFEYLPDVDKYYGRHVEVDIS